VRRSRELVVLLVAFAALAIFVLWYVGQRRAENRARGQTGPRELGPFLAAPAAPPVDLTQAEGKTVDFSSGRPVVKDSPEDRAALERGLREIEEARKGVTFEAAPQEKPKEEPRRP
jgi:hypothetical protein